MLHVYVSICLHVGHFLYRRLVHVLVYYIHDMYMYFNIACVLIFLIFHIKISHLFFNACRHVSCWSDFRSTAFCATTNGRITQRHKDLDDHGNGTDEFKQLSDRDEDRPLLNLCPIVESQPDGIATPSLIADIAVNRITNAFRTRAKGSIFVLKPQTWKSRLYECKREREKQK